MNLTEKIKNNLKDKHFGEVLKGSIFTFLARGFAAVFALGLQVIIARFYGADVLGVTELINSFLMIVVIFALMGTQVSILRFIPEYTKKYSSFVAYKVYRKVLYFILLLSIFITVIIFLNSHFISVKIFKKPQYLTFFVLASFFIPFRALYEYYMAVARGLKLIKGFAFLQLTPSLSNLIILSILTIFFYHKYNPVYSLLIAFTVTALAGLFISEFKFRIQNSKSKINNPTLNTQNPKSKIQNPKFYNYNKPDIKLKYLLTISFPMFLTTSMSYINNQAGVLLLGMFRSESEIGYYAIAVKLATLTSFVLTAINSMIAPKFSELYHSGEMDELFQVVRKSTKLIFWSTAPILIGLVVFGKFILLNFFGKEFINSYTPLLVLVVGQFVNAICGSVGYFLNMTGNERFVSIVIMMSCIINVALGYVLIPKYGINGAAIASGISMIFWNMAMVIFIKRRFNFLFIYRPVF